jgi:hypothetical protein
MVDRRAGGDVIKGGSGGWFGFAEECDKTTAEGDGAGDEPEDMIVAIEGERRPQDCVPLVVCVPRIRYPKQRIRLSVRMYTLRMRNKRPVEIYRYKEAGVAKLVPPNSLVPQAVSHQRRRRRHQQKYWVAKKRKLI